MTGYALPAATAAPWATVPDHLAVDEDAGDRGEQDHRG